MDRFACRLEVHVVDADNALVGIAVVSVKHLVQMQIHRMRFIGARVKCLLIFRIADEGNHGVKRIHEYRAVFVHVGAARITAAFFMVSRTSNDQNELIITKTRQFYKRRALTGIATGKRLSIRAKM